ncbi:SIMPL domain-containing protein [Pontibacter ruber]|uniref:SIMPL domain-containing protein n=1 Tax=Pontibacter ruber TaxID=1343895 RepID=A0ABW5CZP1_9BACT|nr:SIMPL domain-containing protein [Pontibacter ruber]
MKNLYLKHLVLVFVLGALSSCENQTITGGEQNYLEVIGEHEQTYEEAGYRINLAYNGPLSMRDRFQQWADSLQQKHPGMVKVNDNLFVNYMPEQMDKKISRSMFQVGVTYNLYVADTAVYNQITRDALRSGFPFSINVTGTYMSPARKIALQKDMMQKALDNAKTKLDYLSRASGNRAYTIVGVEELDANVPFGPEYYDYNRRAVSRLKVKARLE